MAKMMSKDSQIILNMMKVQDCINSVLDSKSDENLIKDNKSIDLLTYYIVKMYSMRKCFSGKTKKALTLFDDFKGKTVINSLTYCYPTISHSEIIETARYLADVSSRDAFSTQYAACIKESVKYEAE